MDTEEEVAVIMSSFDIARRDNCLWREPISGIEIKVRMIKLRNCKPPGKDKFTEEMC